MAGQAGIDGSINIDGIAGVQALVKLMVHIHK